MKSKITTYLLLAAVAAIWGIIAWKVLSPSRPDTPGNAAVCSASAKQGVPDTLLLNYRDPFLSVRKAAPVSVPTTGFTLRPLPVAPAPKKTVKHNVRYIGRIRRTGVEYSLVEISGTHHTMKTGETQDGYRLEQIFADSLHFVFDGERCCIKLAQ